VGPEEEMAVAINLPPSWTRIVLPQVEWSQQEGAAQQSARPGPHHSPALREMSADLG
jgi:hypothetical protein